MIIAWNENRVCEYKYKTSVNPRLLKAAISYSITTFLASIQSLILCGVLNEQYAIRPVLKQVFLTKM